MNELIQVITQLIGNVGFPIAAFLLMWYQNYKMSEALNRNTEAIQELKDSIKEKKKDD